MYAVFHLPQLPLQARLRESLERWLEPVAVIGELSPDTTSAASNACESVSSSPAGDHALTRVGSAYRASLREGRRGADGPKPSVKGSKARVLAMTPPARHYGVESGMSAAQALARCGDLALLDRCRKREADCQDRLLEQATRLSPDYESTAPGLVTIDLSTHSLRTTFDKEEEAALWRRQALSWIAPLQEAGLRVCVGLAENPDLAALAARTAREVQLITGDATTVREALADFPLAVIAPPPDLSATFFLWGIETLGALTALPRHELVERLGEEAGELWDHAAGRRTRLLRLLRPPQTFSQEVGLDYEVETLEPLLFLLRRSLETLVARLTSSWLAARELTLTLLFHANAPLPQCLRLPEPSGDVDRLFRVLSAHLERLEAPAPVTGFRLELFPIRPAIRPFDLFETGLRDPHQFAETLARLEALLGEGRVGSPLPGDSHHPASFRVGEFREHEDSATRDTDQGSFGTSEPLPFPDPFPEPALPLHRFRPAIPLHLASAAHEATGDETRPPTLPGAILSGPFRGVLRYREGPWKYSGDWWERKRCWSRQEWDVQLEDGTLCRLAREQRQWFLEGIYG